MPADQPARRRARASRSASTADGAPVVVVCSVGIDLDLVPFAADARHALAGPDARLVLAVPERDVHPVTRELAARLAEPAEVVPVPRRPAARALAVGRVACPYA